MSSSKPYAKSYASSKINSARLPSLTSRYAVTTHFSLHAASIIPRHTIQSFHQKANLNNQLLEGRKKNHLNSQAHRRDDKLKKIYNENNRMSKRINSQKSLYSQKSLNSSNASIRTITRSNSRQSTKRHKTTSKLHKVQKNHKKQHKIQLIEQNVEKMNQNQIQQFKNIFTMSQKNKHIREVGYLQREVKTEHRINLSGMGNILHRIAQELSKPTNKSGLVSRF